MKKITFLFLVLILVFSIFILDISVIRAETSPSADVTAKINLINQLNQQIQALQAQLNSLVSQQQSNVADLARTLKQGSSGDDVKILQAILAADSTIYPEGLITGYYGNATAKAVAKFQAKNGISAVGVVGPQTLAKLKEVNNENQVGIEQDSTTHQSIACAKVPPGHLIAPGWLRKNGNQKPIVPTCQTLPPGIAQKLNGESSDHVAPVISAINTTNITATGATVSWNTNESATGKVYFGVTNPLVLTSALTVSDLLLTTSPTVNLTGLTASTPYYFIVEAKDASNNTSTSAQQTFTTLNGN